MRSIRGLLAAVLFGAALTGCGGLTIPLNHPSASGPSFSDASARAVTLKVVDARAGEDTTFHVMVAGLRGAKISLEGVDSPIAFLSENLGKELAGRGYPVKVVTDATADLELQVKRYRIVSRRVSGFSPWEGIHEFAGVIKAAGKEKPIFAYFYNAKVPVWSMKEVYGPCFDVPQAILVKDVASKINRALLGFRSTDAVVEELAAKAAPKDAQNDGPYQELVELGGTNNPKAMEVLKRYASHKDEFVRAVALDAIGMLGSDAELPFLKERFAALKAMDRFMALKAIADAGTPEAASFVAAQKSDKDYSGEAGFQHLVDLYGGK